MGLPAHTRMHAAIALACACVAVVRPALAEDVLNLSIEQLLDVKVVSASRYEQKSADVAAAPQVISSEEIRASGARNLIEVLALFGGVNVHSDGVYSRLGARGFLRTGDFNARILLLIDGRRFNELAYDGAYLGEEGPVEVSLIERLEYIPGPGSSVYGSNALLGVINIITKKPGDMPAANAAIEGSDRRYLRSQGGFALKFDNGVSGMLQLSRYQAPGRFRDASEIGGTPADVRSAGRDREWANRLFARVDWGDFSLSAVYVNREVNIANGAYLTATDVGSQPNRDRMANVDISYAKELNPDLRLSTRLAVSDYAFHGTTVAPATTPIIDVEVARVRWVDADAKLIAKWHQDSTLVAGVELTRVTKLDFLVDLMADRNVSVDQHSTYTRWGVYAQNDWIVAAPLTLSFGARLDGQTGRDSVYSPRFGAIYRPATATAIKLQHGRAFRNPNAYELYYNVPEVGYRTNPALRAERVTSNELTLEREFGAGVSLRVTAYRNKIDKLIDFVVDPVDEALVFSNIGAAVIEGIQTDLHLMQAGGWRARIGATFQRGMSHDAGGVTPLRNSPRRLGHVALFTPHWRGFGSGLNLYGSAILQYVGPQQGRDGIVGGYSLVNTTLVADEIWPGWSATLGVKNVFNRAYQHPLGDDFVQSGERGAAREVWLGARVRY